MMGWWWRRGRWRRGRTGATDAELARIEAERTKRATERDWQRIHEAREGLVELIDDALRGEGA